jgi:hypothetical protein
MEFSAAFFFTAQLYNSSIMITAAKGSFLTGRPVWHICLYIPAPRPWQTMVVPAKLMNE